MSNKKKQIRQQFRDAVFKRDGYKCRVCGNSGQLDAHHILNYIISQKKQSGI